MNLLTRPFLTSALTVVSGLATYFHLIPTALSDAYIGEAVTSILGILAAVGAYRNRSSTPAA